MKLVMVRHGQSLWNKENLFTGWADVDLTEQGKVEAIEAGKLLADYNFDRIFCSELTRAKETLKGILADKTTNAHIIYDWHLNERHYGALEGLNKKDTAEKYGEEQVKIWRRSFDIPPPPLGANDERYIAHQKKYPNLSLTELPKSESLKDTLARVQPYWENKIKPHLVRENILIVAHGNSLRALIKILEDIDDQKILEVNIPTGAPREYVFTKNLSLEKFGYLGNQDDIAKRAKEVANQAK